MQITHKLRFNDSRFGNTRQKIKSWVLKGFFTTLSPYLRWCGRRKKISITCARTDGGGAQWHARLSTLAFCRFFGFTYFHSSIEPLLPIDSSDLRKNWNGLIVNGSDVPNPYPSFDPKPVSLAGLILTLISGHFNPAPLVLSLSHCHAFTDFFPKQIEALIEQGNLRYANPKSLSTNQPGVLPTLAIHLRRGHMAPSDEPMRLTTNQMVLDTLRHLTSRYGPFNATIYSAMPDAVLTSMLPKGVAFNSSADEFEVLHNLISADYMVMAKSSMSYVAGIFCVGTVFYEPFWHPPLSCWKELPTKSSHFEKL